jgi:hypothetical protein
MNLRYRANDGTKTDLSLALAMDTTLRYRVKEAKPDGTVLSVVVEGGKLLDAAAQAQALPREPDDYPRTATLDRLGRLIALKDSGKAGQNSGSLDALMQQANWLVALHFLPLPEKPVRVGDTWSARYPLPNAKLASAPPPDGGADDPNAMRATLTLLGTEKVGDLETLKIKQVLTLPFEAMVDATGRATRDAGKATGRVHVRLTFTQTVNALPADGEMVRSQGDIDGSIKFEGSVAKQVPSDTMTIGGRLLAARLPDEAASTPKGR